MRLDFSSIPLRNRAFSDKPMTFIDKLPKEILSAILDVVAIETGNRSAREYWQQTQLQGLLLHAAQRSPIWKKRIGTLKAKGMRLSDLPVQSRADAVRQVESEGSLVKASETSRITKHSTSGSTGTPVPFFVTQRNGNYNSVRSLAQFFMEGLDLSLNRTRVRSTQVPSENGFIVKRHDGWAGALDGFLRTGLNKHIDYFRPNLDALCRELLKDPMGYVVAQPRIVEALFDHAGIEFFRTAGAAMLVPIAETLHPSLRDAFVSAGIPVRANYSCEEAALVASECETVAEHYHVATSNVLVEVVDAEVSARTGTRVGRILVTNLHSHATPFIRYDVGDVGTLLECCPCGHDGPVLSNIYGRAKSFVKHADGTETMFFLRGKELTAIARLDEYRIRQTGFQNIVVEIGGRDQLSAVEMSGLTALIKEHAGEEFAVEIKPTPQIDWGHSVKRLGFACEI